MARFDVIYAKDSCYCDYHFCREFDENDVGCYGTNPLHGYSFEEAKEIIANFYKMKAERWKKVTLQEWKENGGAFY